MRKIPLLLLLFSPFYSVRSEPLGNLQFEKAIAAIDRIVETDQKIKEKDLANKPVPKGIKLVVKGKDGIPFPAEEDLILSNEALFSLENLAKITQLAVESYFEKISYSPKDIRKLNDRIPRCIKGITKEKILDYNGDDQIYYDVLFISKDQKPYDPEERFGRGVDLRIVEKGSVEELQGLGAFDVECLPYRITISDKLELRTYGEQALRAYP